MAINIQRTGFGQIEPNHLSAQRNGKIYAQLPAHIKKGTGTQVDTAETITILENGQFAKYDYANGEVNFNTAPESGEWMLVYNEVKLYESKKFYKDFALKASNYTDGVITPRLFKTDVGDIFTTNAIKVGNTAGDVKLADSDKVVLSKGDLLTVGANGFLVSGGDIGSDDFVWQVVEETTMPDGDNAVKVRRVK